MLTTIPLPQLDCLSCGACCQRIGRPPFPGFSRDRQGKPCTEFDPVTKHCRIYETRPYICRDFAVGGSDCLKHRAWEGIA